MCGYTYREIDRMQLPEIWELFAYWKREPPVHVLVAGFLGYKPPVEAATKHKPTELTDADRRAAASFGAAVPFDRLPLHLQQALKETPSSE